MINVGKTLLLFASALVAINAVEMEQVQDRETASLVSNVSQNLVQLTQQEVDLFLSNPSNETLVNLLNSLALPLGRVLQLVVGSGMNASESANLVGLVVGEWLNATVEGDLTALDVNGIENEVVGTVQNTLRKNLG